MTKAWSHSVKSSLIRTVPLIFHHIRLCALMLRSITILTPIMTATQDIIPTLDLCFYQILTRVIIKLFILILNNVSYVLKHILKTSLLKNSCGQDGIYSKLLEKNEGRLSGALDCHYKPITVHRCFQYNIKPAKVITLLKKGNPYPLNNYGPITLFSILSKFLDLFHSFQYCPKIFKKWFSSRFVHISPIKRF